MNETLVSLAITVVLILLPLIPAVLLFRYLPSSGQVDGTFQGMRYKFGGAAAGYFAVLLILALRIFPELHHQTELLERIAKAQEDALHMDKYETWHVLGAVKLAQEDPNRATADMRVRLVPPAFQSMPGGRFDYEVPVLARGNDRTFPNVVFDHDGYAGFTLCLTGKDQCDFGNSWVDQTSDSLRRYITLKAPIVLEPIGAYTGGQQPVPIGGTASVTPAATGATIQVR
jgi:hypothetical protein